MELSMIRGVLLDLSGVIYIGDHLIAGATEAVRRLQEAGMPVRFITNTTRSTRATILGNLFRMGLDLAPEALFTAPLAARAYVQRHGLNPLCVVHPGLAEDLPEATAEPHDAVLIGDAGDEFTYENMNRAFRLLLEGAPLLAMGNNRYFKETDGYSLDVGPFVAALEYAANTTATVLGKPAPQFFHEAVGELGCAPGEVVMVGDDVVSDVKGAIDAGLQAVLVRTGKYRPEDENQLDVTEARVVDDIAAAVRWILKDRD
jgi:HAD superfamily hydrolase (TIGR01458 family)